ncbi:MAG: nucleoside deaminase [Bacteroidia bacterium]|nr:nucleoside deaminase [Bacteroidia bacterium]MBN4052383.1 nucleoside deaminase [Sphingobacteriaceae bacterium AH-315-L07]
MKELSDEHFMKEALKEAQKALEQDEVPIGAVVVSNNKVIARAHNLSQLLTDATAHAEMQAITAASEFMGSKYLIDCTLYVTLEPCAMCAGATFWSQVSKIVFGASDLKRGFRSINKGILHPKTLITSGILEDECSILLKEFFEKKRKLA